MKVVPFDRKPWVTYNSQTKNLVKEFSTDFGNLSLDSRKSFNFFYLQDIYVWFKPILFCKICMFG